MFILDFTGKLQKHNTWFHKMLKDWRNYEKQWFCDTNFCGTCVYQTDMVKSLITSKGKWLVNIIEDINNHMMVLWYVVVLLPIGYKQNLLSKVIGEHAMLSGPSISLKLFSKVSLKWFVSLTLLCNIVSFNFKSSPKVKYCRSCTRCLMHH